MPDIILLDVSMPEMDGFEVCKQLKANEATQNIPIIFLTARTELENMLYAFKLGAADYVTKPFNAQELLARVNAHLEIKLSRDVINAQNLRLTELNNTKNKFFSIIAHDLKNPFTSIILSTELLMVFLEQNNIEKAKAKTKAILDTSNFSFLLLQNLLDWSLSQLGNIQFSPKIIEATPVIQQVIELARFQAENKKISLQYSVPENLKINVDINLFQIIIRNLITNAIKFTQEGGEVQLEVNIREHEVLFAVKDTGIGISAEMQEKLFKPGEKFMNKGTNQEKGTGLGLILCKEFVEKHGGRIWVESEQNSGSTFKFVLPL